MGRLEGWPAFFTGYRPGQEEAVTETIELFRSGVKTVMLDGPTGSGKTFVANGVRLGLGVPTTYSCHSKGLQHQFHRDFPWAAVLQGRDNYPIPGAGEDVTAADCTWRKDERCIWERWCGGKATCPYEMAKRRAMTAGHRVVNHSYFTSEAKHVGLWRTPCSRWTRRRRPKAWYRGRWRWPTDRGCGRDWGSAPPTT
jgi:Rad3-related DNA helicases